MSQSHWDGFKGKRKDVNSSNEKQVSIASHIDGARTKEPWRCELYLAKVLVRNNCNKAI